MSMFRPVLRALPGAFVVCVFALAGCGRQAETGARSAPQPGRPTLAASNPQARKLLEITEHYYDQYLELNPWTATEEGDHRFDARFGDYASLAWMADSLAIEQDALERLEAVDPEKLDGENLVTYQAFRTGRAIRAEGYRYPSELLPVQPYANLAVDFAVAGSGQGIQPFAKAQDYDNFLSRMDGFVAWVDQVIRNMRSGVEHGIVLPRVVVAPLLPQIAALAAEDPRQSIFWRPILAFPAGISVADRQRLTRDYAARLATQVLPAYRRLHDYLKKDYLPRARAGIGMSELPNGASWYAYLVRYHTDTALTPDEVHRLGLAEVTRIRAEMERVGREVGYAGDLRAFLESLRAEPRFQYADPAELLAAYGALSQRVAPALPLLFAVGPKARFEIRPVEAFRATMAGAASYVPPSADGRRPGVLYVNAYDLSSRQKFLAEATFLREALPGHHLQISIAEEARHLPRFQRFGWNTAYGDGWAMYAQSLGRDLGLYTDSYSALGALSNEMRNAAGLVVDTGIHSRGWSRDRAVEYLRANTALGESEITADVDRCIAEPGSALGYKLGQLEILGLRQRAQQALGPRFDVRAFHTQLLESGSLPLPVLGAKIDRWLAKK
jgi:uncharacterized protein (DUF885 family)